MQAIRKSLRTRAPRRLKHSRLASILPLAAGVMVLVFGFTAFTVDIGYISLTKSQLQSAADAAALAAGLELPQGLSTAPIKTQDQVAVLARAAAVDVAGRHSAGGVSSVYADGSRDVQFGRLVWDSQAQSWGESWGTGPYNMVRVTLRRDQTMPTGAPVATGDAPLNLFFGPALGTKTASLTETATAALTPGGGFRIPAGSTATINVLPFALDLQSWTALMNGTGNDNYAYNSATGAVTTGADGVKEVDLYPYGNSSLPPGNRGTVDLGAANNSTADISRQIRYGLNADDLSYFGGELRFDSVPLVLNGDTGLSAGFKDDLAAIKGQPRAIPIFSAVSGPGNNAMYTIVKFVGIRIVYVQLTGKNKQVIVQPAPFTDAAIVPGTGGNLDDGFFSPLRLIH